jgi:hypothetical protein
MIVADFWPVWPMSMEADRDIETLTYDEWGEVIVELDGLRMAFESAAAAATDAWAKRWRGEKPWR